mgnify:CR=1 FL=1
MRITSRELSNITGISHIECCLRLYDILTEDHRNPNYNQVCKPDSFYYSFDEEEKEELLCKLENYEINVQDA